MATPQEVADGLPTEMNELQEEDIERWADAQGDGEPQEAAVTLADDAEPESMSQQPESQKQGKPSQKAKSDAEKKPVINWSEYPEFKEYQARHDREREELRRKLAEAETRAAQREEQQQAIYLQQLQARMPNAEDDNERAALIEQMAAIRSQTYMTQERRWAQHVRERAEDEGLDPQAFDPISYRGEAGALKFERDVAAAAKEKLRKELDAAKKAAAPEVVAQIVRQEVAKALRAKGVDAGVETAAPGAPSTDEDAEWRDLQLVNKGKMTEAQYRKKHGS